MLICAGSSPTQLLFKSQSTGHLDGLKSIRAPRISTVRSYKVWFKEEEGVLPLEQIIQLLNIPIIFLEDVNNLTFQKPGRKAFFLVFPSLVSSCTIV